MVVDVALYTVVHQPRRLKLPAQPIPRCASVEDITRCLFDERLNERYFRQVAQSCYYPAARMFLELVRQRGLRLAMGISLSFVRQAALWDPALLDLFRELVAEKNVEVIGVEPYRSLQGLIDLPAFVSRMGWMTDEIERIFGKRPVIADIGEAGLSTSLYNALDVAGFQGALMDISPQVMQWRSSNYLYRSNDGMVDIAGAGLSLPGRNGSGEAFERIAQGMPRASRAPLESNPYLLTRHVGLSTDVSERFSDRTWAGYPLYASSYAGWLERVDGDFALLGWDFEIFGERHTADTGIFEFMRALPDELAQRGIATRTPGELIKRFADERVYDLPLPVHSAGWSSPSHADSYFEYEPQHALFQLMSDVYNLARLTENPELLDLSLWLMQADNFRLVDWPGPQLAYATVPYDWWRLGPSGLLYEQRQVYRNLLSALEPHLPVRALRRESRKSAELASVVADARETKEFDGRKMHSVVQKSRPAKEQRVSQNSGEVSRAARSKVSTYVKEDDVMSR